MTTIIDTELRNCSGCGACINACPVDALYYSKDKYGFIYPGIKDNKCIKCGKCVNVCPKDNHEGLNEPFEAYAATNNNEDALLKSSSGGIFTLLAEEILHSRGCVFGCTMNEEKKVFHTIIESINDLHKIQKSKYVQSFMGDTYKQIKTALEEKKWVLVCGTPCIVSGVKNYLGGMNTSKLILVDLVCHGVPSQEFFDDYLDDLQDKLGKIKQYEFRTKKDAHSGMTWLHSYSFVDKKKKILKNWPEDSFNFLYMGAYIYRESCYSCQYAGLERAGDITLCDYWNWHLYHDEFDNETAVSGVLINTEKGQFLWNKVKRRASTQKTKIDNIVKNNGCLQEPSNRPSEREQLLAAWKCNGYSYIQKEFKKRARVTIWKNKLFRVSPEWIKKIYLYRKKKG